MTQTSPSKIKHWLLTGDYAHEIRCINQGTINHNGERVVYWELTHDDDRVRLVQLLDGDEPEQPSG